MPASLQGSAGKVGGQSPKPMDLDHLPQQTFWASSGITV